jgi:hypothetical protein
MVCLEGGYHLPALEVCAEGVIKTLLAGVDMDDEAE